jgi:Fic family protein
MNTSLQFLPPSLHVETIAILRKLPTAHRYLAELKGMAATIPNESILINTLALQEAKDSSAIENIITTHDELYKAQLFNEVTDSPAAKEVSNYAEALKYGFELVRTYKFLSSNHIIEIQRILEGNTAGFRKVPGTSLINQATGEVIYTPPQDPNDILALMDNLVAFINTPSLFTADPLVKMAIIHFQFESIHPFYDGNGRTGRIINILYLVLQELLSLPTVYVSRYIIKNKAEYYSRLQAVRDSGDWENWILYMLDAIEQTSRETIEVIVKIKTLMQQYKMNIRKTLPKIYSQDLLNNIFRHPYTKIEFVQHDVGVSRITATRYLDALAEAGFLEKQKIGRTNFYVNVPLFAIFTS